MTQKHSLGFGNGKIIEYEDGSIGYVPTGLTQAFRVQIADVTGFSVTKGGKMMERTINTSATARCWRLRAFRTVRLRSWSSGFGPTRSLGKPPRHQLSRQHRPHQPYRAAWSLMN